MPRIVIGAFQNCHLLLGFILIGHGKCKRQEARTLLGELRFGTGKQCVVGVHAAGEERGKGVRRVAVSLFLEMIKEGGYTRESRLALVLDFDCKLDFGLANAAQVGQAQQAGGEAHALTT